MRANPRPHSPIRAAALTLAALALAVPLSADDPPQKKPINKLHGVVVSKQDGKPLSAVHVAMAHAEKGYVVLEREGQLRTFGPDQKVLWFLTKRNSKTACEDTTDSEGRFTFESFTSPAEEYNFVAAHPKHGVALLTGLVPKKYQDKPLRIEMDEPSFITTDWKPSTSFGQTWEYVNVSLAPQSDDSADAPRVYLNVFTPTILEEKKSKLGPLPGNVKYRVTRYGYSQELAYAATLFAREVYLESGQTTKLALRSEKGTTVSGCVTGTDGQPLANVNVLAKTRDAAGLVIGAVTDKKGNYTLTGVPVGTHDLELLRHAKRTTPG